MRRFLHGLLAGALVTIFTVASYAKLKDDIYYHGFYYGKDGAVVFRIPELPDSQWTQIGPVKSGDVHFIQLYLGNPKSYQGMIMMFILPPQKKKVDTKAELIALYKNFQSGSPALKPVSDPSALEINGGKGHQLFLKGKNAKGVEENAAIAVVANGAGAFALMVRGNPAAMEKQLLPVVKLVMDSIQMGDAVKNPPKANPGNPLEGVYLGPYHINYDGSGTQYWLIFDKNGYVSEQAPENPLYLDLSAYYLYNPKKLGTYQVTGSQLKIKWLGSGKTVTYAYKNSGGIITLDKDEYKLLSGKGDGMKLNGKYEAFDYYSSSYGLGDQFSYMSSSSYKFDTKGNFESASYVGSHYSETSINGNLIDWVDASSEKKSKKGKYVIKNNMIVLSYDNGAIAELTFYPHVRKDGKIDDALIYIGGENYLHED
ncbi:MAG: hypothetical protein HPY53_11365 [Brevinematales bacterium]|nr:hypothetical protein [Brevinematales bacterium]